MDPIAEIQQRLENFEAIRVEAGDNFIRYPPSSDPGFVVECSKDNEGYTVAFGGWHEHFPDAETAVNCFLFCLSDRCRLKIVSRGGTPHKWIVESLEDGEWVADSTTGAFIYAFWRRARVDYRQNALIEANGNE